MMFVIYWLLLAFGGVVTVAGIALLAVGAFRRQRRALFLSLGFASFLVAWAPTAAFFAFLFAMGARPAG